MEEDEEINVHTSKRKKVILVILLGIVVYIAWILIEGLYIIPNDYGTLELNEVEKFNFKFISNVWL